MKLNCSINFHQDLAKCLSGQTDSVDQGQTAQTVQSDDGFTLSVNLLDIFLLYINIYNIYYLAIF